MNQKKKSHFKTGMYLLETLTTGMYNEPLAIYREYIQNSVDSIDLISKKDTTPFNVNIQLDPFNRKITISDNGYGLSVNIAEEILYTIGSSNKMDSTARGFRGIGRLGGIAFSDTVTFRTKAIGENIESIQEWDCKKLRSYLSDPNQSKLSLSQVVKKVSKFYKANGKDASGSYFSVTLDGVSSFRNYIFDINKVMKYISQIAPIDFNPKEFSYGNQINKWLFKNLTTYGTYNIFLNDMPIYKPYRDIIRTNKKGSDSIIGIKKIKIKIKDHIAAYGWYGIRKNLLGGIAKGVNSSGIRVRVGNILIGDSHLLDGCFREDRFNSYVFGEIHINSPYLIPNSRRDDFVDNEYKTLFYNAVEKEIGLPLSKEIRLKSKLQTKKREELNKPQLPNKVPLIDLNKRILVHPSVDKILNEIIKIFGSKKEFKKILSDHSIF